MGQCYVIDNECLVSSFMLCVFYFQDQEFAKLFLSTVYVSLSHENVSMFRLPRFLLCVNDIMCVVSRNK